MTHFQTSLKSSSSTKGESNLSPTQALATAIPTYAPEPNSLMTTFVGGEESYGNMFDIFTLKALKVTGLDIHTNIDGANVIVEIRTRKGSYTNEENDGHSTKWSSVAKVAVQGQGPHKKTQIPVDSFSQVTIAAFSTQAFYVTLTTPQLAFTSHTPDESETVASNEDLEILVGAGVPNYPLNNTLDKKKVFNGILRYSLVDPSDEKCTYPWENASRIKTQYTGENGSFGNMFEINALKTIVMHSLSFHTTLTKQLRYRVYVKNGTYIGFEESDQMWYELTSGFVKGMGVSVGTLIPSDNFPHVLVKSGEICSIFIVLDSADMRFSDGTEEGSVTSLNDDLQIMEGNSVSQNGFGQLHFAPRTWDGAIFYNTVDEDCVSALAQAIPTSSKIPSMAPSFQQTIPPTSKSLSDSGLTKTNIVYAYVIEHRSNMKQQEVFTYVIDTVLEFLNDIISSQQSRFDYVSALNALAAERPDSKCTAISIGTYCITIEVTVSVTHDENMPSETVRRSFILLAQDILLELNFFNKLYIGIVIVQTQTAIVLDGVNLTNMTHDDQALLENSVRYFLKSELHAFSPPIKISEVFLDDMKLIYPATGGTSTNRTLRKLQSATEVHFNITGEYQPPPDSNFEHVVEIVFVQNIETFRNDISQLTILQGFKGIHVLSPGMSWKDLNLYESPEEHTEESNPDLEGGQGVFKSLVFILGIVAVAILLAAVFLIRHKLRNKRPANGEDLDSVEAEEIELVKKTERNQMKEKLRKKRREPASARSFHKDNEKDRRPKSSNDLEKKMKSKNKGTRQFESKRFCESTSTDIGGSNLKRDSSAKHSRPSNSREHRGDRRSRCKSDDDSSQSLNEKGGGLGKHHKKLSSSENVGDSHRRRKSMADAPKRPPISKKSPIRRHKSAADARRLSVSEHGADRGRSKKSGLSESGNMDRFNTRRLSHSDYGGLNDHNTNRHESGHHTKRMSAREGDPRRRQKKALGNDHENESDRLDSSETSLSGLSSDTSS